MVKTENLEDEEDLKAIARLFVDVGDSYVELIAIGSSEAMMIVNALLEVASLPEYDIASMTFNFWHSLQVILTKRYSNISSGDDASVEAERNRRLQVFRQSYESFVSLVSLLVHHLENSALVVSLMKGQIYFSVPVIVIGEGALRVLRPLLSLGDRCQKGACLLK
ncbi:hypothetical protein PTKIN_Ptkin05aG0162700 [Pterospermum kingtungense]